MSGISGFSLSGRTTMRVASTLSMKPSRRARVQTPESRASLPSMPVPTSGAWLRMSGTAWRCMFAPMSARFASSCSRKGTSAAATLTIWFGATSSSWIMSGVTMWKSPLRRALTSDSRNLPFSSIEADACAMYFPSSSRAEYHETSSVPRPSDARRYGVSTKPYSLTRANVESDAMRPMFGPSGVSMGQMRP